MSVDAYGPRIRLVLRYDDVSWGSPADLDAFVCRSVVEAGLAITAAVVPVGPGPEDSRAPGIGADEDAFTRPFGPRDAERLAADGPGRVEVALHGLDHLPVGRDPRGRPAEFGGLPEARQRERLARGIRVLERALDTRPTTFVPPWNRYDAGTVAALESLGFRALSAGRDAPPAATTLRILPATATLLEIEPAVRTALRHRGATTIVGLVHPYDFEELGSPWGCADRERWSDLLAWLAACPDVGSWTVGGLAAADAGLDADRARSYAAYHASSIGRWIPPVRPGSSERPLPTYPTTAEIRSLARHRLVATPLGWSGVVVAAGIGGLLLGRALSATPGTVVAALSSVAAIGVWVRSRAGDGPHFRGRAATVVAAALSLGAWVGRVAG